MSTKSPPIETTRIESRKATETADFELAYRAMLGELASSFLHELNNPLTVLVSSAGLLKNFTPDETELKEVVENISTGSHTLTEISECYRRILNANTDAGLYHIKRLCDDMIMVLGYRFKQVSLAPELSIDPDNFAISLTAREFYFCFYFVLLLYMHIFVFMCQDSKAEHLLRIEISNDNKKYLRLTVHLLDDSSNKIVKTTPEPQVAFSRLMPTFFEEQVSAFFHFAMQQTLRIFNNRRITAAWDVGLPGMKLNVTFPCMTPDSN